MDALDTMIARERQELERLQASLDVQKIKVETLIAAAAARPSQRANALAKASGSSGGKPKGAISVAWRRVMNDAYALGHRVAYSDIRNLYMAAHGKAPEIASIRDRVRNFIEWGFIEGSPEDGFIVTQLAVEKFDFGKPAEAPKENEPRSETAGGSDAAGVGVGPLSPAWDHSNRGADA